MIVSEEMMRAAETLFEELKEVRAMAIKAPRCRTPKALRLRRTHPNSSDTTRSG